MPGLPAQLEPLTDLIEYFDHVAIAVHDRMPVFANKQVRFINQRWTRYISFFNDRKRSRIVKRDIARVMREQDVRMGFHDVAQILLEAITFLA